MSALDSVFADLLNMSENPPSAKLDRELDDIRAHTARHGTRVAYYVLAPELAAERRAQFLGICEECGRMEYVDVLPRGARMAGEGRA